mgnify:CR=1 FL=1
MRSQYMLAYAPYFGRACVRARLRMCERVCARVRARAREGRHTGVGGYRRTDLVELSPPLIKTPLKVHPIFL